MKNYIIYHKLTGEITNCCSSSIEDIKEHALDKEYICNDCGEVLSESAVKYQMNITTVLLQEFREFTKNDEGNRIENQVYTCPKCSSSNLTLQSNYELMEVDTENFEKAKRSEYFKVDTKTNKVEKKQNKN